MNLIQNTTPTAAEKKAIAAVSAEIAAIEAVISEYETPVNGWAIDNTKAHYACDATLAALQETPTAATAKAHLANLLFRRDLVEFSKEIIDGLNTGKRAESAKLKPLADAILDRTISDAQAAHESRLEKLREAGLDQTDERAIAARHASNIAALQGQRESIEADPFAWLAVQGFA